MRSSKSRSRSKQNRPRSLGNVINRVFDSSGPEGKVRGTPQQVIDKYLQLARDAQLSNDRVASENFQQHAEHYIRMLSEATREMMRDQDGRPGGDDQRRDDGYGEQPRGAEVLDLGEGRYGDSGLVETPEHRQQPRNDNRGNDNRSNGNRSNDNRGGENRSNENRSNDSRSNDNRNNDSRSNVPRTPQPPREPRPAPQPAQQVERAELPPRDNAPMMAGLIAEAPATAPDAPAGTEAARPAAVRRPRAPRRPRAAEGPAPATDAAPGAEAAE
jgi:hypothetical protein